MIFHYHPILGLQYGCGFEFEIDLDALTTTFEEAINLWNQQGIFF